MLVAFVAWQRRAAHPLVPLRLFSIRNFAGANVTTAFVYAAGAMGALSITLYTQEVAGYCATVAGLATLPTPVLSFLLARRIGGLAARIGPRVFLTTGPLLAGLGLLLIRPRSRIQHRHSSAARDGRGGHWPGADHDAAGRGESDIRRAGPQRSRRGHAERGGQDVGPGRGGLRGTDRQRHADRYQLRAAAAGRRGAVLRRSAGRRHLVGKATSRGRIHSRQGPTGV